MQWWTLLKKFFMAFLRLLLLVVRYFWPLIIGLLIFFDLDKWIGRFLMGICVVFYFKARAVQVRTSERMDRTTPCPLTIATIMWHVMTAR